MRDLESYIVEAQRQIGKWGGRWMRNNEDVIANVASAIIRAEHDHDPTKGASLSTLRCVYGRRQIWAEYRSMKRKIVNGIPLPIDAADFEFVEDNSEPFVDTILRKEEMVVARKRATDILKKSKLLSPKQRKYLKARFLRGRSVKEIAESNKISKQGVAESISNGLKKLRKELAGTCS